MKILALRVLPWEEANRLPQRIDFFKTNIAKHTDYSEIYIRPIHSLGYYLGYIVGFILTIPRLLSRKYHILLLENSYLIVFGFIARLSRRQVIAEYVDYYPNMLIRIWRTRRMRYYIAVLLCDIFSKLANYIVVEAQGTKKGVTDLGIPSSKVCIIEHSPDPNIMKFQGREEIRRKYDLSDESFVIGYLGKIPDHYDLDIIPYAIAAAQPRTKRKLVLMMVGEGTYLSEIKEKVAKLNLENPIFPGKVSYDDVPKYYSAFDVLLFTIKAPIAIKLIEAMLIGTPVITTSGYASDYIKDNLNGFVAKGREPKDYADKIIKLASLSDSEMKELRKKGQEYAYQRFAFAYREYLKLFQRLYIKKSKNQ